jgi:hypothetical protein
MRIIDYYNSVTTHGHFETLFIHIQECQVNTPWLPKYLNLGLLSIGSSPGLLNSYVNTNMGVLHSQAIAN